jgi:sarcosine oxidase, subunit beta
VKKEASVAIIGGGIIGASLAYNLAINGVKNVVVLERSKAGTGTTAASLGGFRHQFSNELSVRLSQRSIKIIEKFQELTGYDPLVRHDGYVFLAASEISYQRLRSDQKFQKSMGVPVELVGRDELQREFPFYRFDKILGGALCMADGHASTMAVLQGYLTNAKRLGVNVHENTEVTAIGKDSSNRFRLITTEGPLASKSVVIAAGAYSGQVGRLASVPVPIEPYPRKVLVTRSFSDGIPDHIPLIIDVDSTLAFGREGRGLIFGTNPPTQPSFELAFPPDYENDVMRAAIDRVPAAENCSLSHAVAGLYEMTPDANPIVGEMPGNEGLYCCAGFAGHGFMHAPAIGELFAELYTKGKTSIDISSYGIERFAGKGVDKEPRII